MIMDREPRVDNQLEAVRHTAVKSLEAYRQTPQERAVRQHLEDAMDSMVRFISGGETAGYVTLPTGSGKTYFAAELVHVLTLPLVQELGLKTVILSPTKPILEHTADVLHTVTPNVKVSNYYSGEKDLSGDVINTTLPSFQNLLRRDPALGSQVGLVIVDEAHTALGEKRHKIYEQLPNALMFGLTATAYFTQIEGYRRRGLVGDERWTRLFSSCIHEMSLEEGIERGILANLDVHLLQTNAVVDNIDVQPGKEYSSAQLERILNTRARNLLTVAILAEPDRLPRNVTFTPQQQAEIARIREKIKGKSTAIFGLSINHIEELRRMLADVGVPSLTYHNEMSDRARRAALKQHESGNSKVILGVDALGVGWDSPRTKVGIYVVPTHSGVVAIQQLGRILRPFPETGEEAIAIQLVDQFRNKSQAPILIPNIFDPYYILRGTQTGGLNQPSGSASEHATRPSIIFEGMNIGVIVEEAMVQSLIQERFIRGSVEDMGKVVDELIDKITKETPNVTSYNLYKTIANMLPDRLPSGRQEQMLQAVASIDSNRAKAGQKAIVFSYLRTILSATEPYLSENEDENEDVAQAALAAVESYLIE